MQEISTDNAPKAIGPYSQAMRSSTFVFTSGQIPLKIDGTLAEGGISAQAEQSIANIRAILSVAGTDISKVVKTTVFLADMADFAAMNAVYEKHFISKPARSTVAVKALPKNVLVEIEAIAEI